MWVVMGEIYCDISILSQTWHITLQLSCLNAYWSCHVFWPRGYKHMHLAQKSDVSQSIRLSLHQENQHYPILFVWIVRCDVTRFKGNDDQDLDLPCDGNPTALNHIQTNEKVMYACQRWAEESVAWQLLQLGLRFWLNRLLYRNSCCRSIFGCIGIMPHQLKT